MMPFCTSSGRRERTGQIFLQNRERTHIWTLTKLGTNWYAARGRCGLPNFSLYSINFLLSSSNVCTILLSSFCVLSGLIRVPVLILAWSVPCCVWSGFLPAVTWVWTRTFTWLDKMWIYEIFILQVTTVKRCHKWVSHRDGEFISWGIFPGTWFTFPGIYFLNTLYWT